MTKIDASSPSITQRVMAMEKAMNEIRRYTISQHINDALNTRNKSFKVSVHDLLINSPILVYQEGNVDQSGE